MGIKHPFFATTAYALWKAMSPQDIDPKNLPISQDLKIDSKEFEAVAPAIASSQSMDLIVNSAMRLRGTPMEPDVLDVLEAYGTIQVAHELIASRDNVAALLAARAALTDLSTGLSSVYADNIKNDGFKRLAVVFAEAGDLYTARRIGQSFVPKEDHLDVWTAVLQADYRPIARDGVAPAARLPLLMEEDNREHGMKYNLPAPWNDERW